jgi:histidyl-tRNA synthetase
MAKKDKTKDALSTVLADTELELTEARKQKEIWATKEQELEIFVNALKSRMGLESTTKTSKASTSPIAGSSSLLEVAKPTSKTYMSMSLSDGIKHYLNSVMEVSSPRDIAQAMIDGGFMTSSPKSLPTMVSTALGRMPEAKRLGTGKWVLKEWRK